MFAANIALNNFSLGYISIGVNLIIRSCLPLSTFVSQQIMAQFNLYRKQAAREGMDSITQENASAMIPAGGLATATMSPVPRACRQRRPLMVLLTRQQNPNVTWPQ